MSTVNKEDLEYALLQLNEVSANKYIIEYHKGYVELSLCAGDKACTIRSNLTKREAFGIIKSIIDYRYYEGIALKERYAK